MLGGLLLLTNPDFDKNIFKLLFLLMFAYICTRSLQLRGQFKEPE